MEKMKPIVILSILNLFFLSSCASFELTEKASEVVFTKEEIIISPSLCTFITHVLTQDGAKTEAEAINNLKNQTADNKGNFVILVTHPKKIEVMKQSKEFGNGYQGLMYDCKNPKSVVSDQKKIDAKENEKKLAEDKAKAEEEAKEIEKQENDPNPHYWVLCAEAGTSDVHPSFRRSILKSLNRKSFDTQEECEDRAFISAQTGSQFGIKCVCQFGRLKKTNFKVP